MMSEASHSFAPDPANIRLLRDAFGRFATGVTVVTAASADGPVAITANSFSSVSLDPPLVLWAPGRQARRFGYFAAAERFAIHVLAADQADLCQAVAKDAFALSRLVHELSADGVPLIPGSLARFECRLEAAHEAGDHLIVVGRVERAQMREGAGLAFFQGRMQAIG